MSMYLSPEDKATWVAALRSGEFPAGKGALARIEDGKVCYCPLGVYCEIKYRQGKLARTSVPGAYVYGGMYGSTMHLPREFGDMTFRFPFKVRPETAVRGAEDSYAEVVSLNDLGDGLTQNQMADLIEFFL